LAAGVYADRLPLGWCDKAVSDKTKKVSKADIMVNNPTAIYDFCRQPHGQGGLGFLPSLGTVGKTWTNFLNLPIIPGTIPLQEIRILIT
jgi:hypothetical protein